jgi:hypothetical protein
VTIVTDELRAKNSRSLFTLLRDLPTQLVALLKAELVRLKTEMVAKAIKAGVGIGLFVVAGLFGFFLLAVLIAAAVLGLAVVFPGWLAALLVAAGLLVLVIIFGLLGLRFLSKAMPPKPVETMTSVKDDVNAIKGVGKYDY